MILVSYFLDEQAAAIGQPLPLTSLQLEAPHYCLKCGAKKFQYEWFHFCCGNGSIRIVTNNIPPELHRLFTSKDEDSLHFTKYACMYNNLFAFCSLGGKTNASFEKGIFVFLLHGQIYHHLPDLLPDNECLNTCSFIFMMHIMKLHEGHKFSLK